MEMLDSNPIQMELKYCERCGALWLRLIGSELVFCSPCSVILAGLAQDPRFLQHRNAASTAPDYELKINGTFWGEGGNA
jgi:ribosomal protein L37AE/L43A